MKSTGWAPLIAGVASAMFVAGCVTTPPRVVSQPAPARPAVVVASPPAQVVAGPAIQEQVVPEPNDVYISAALDSDVVLVGGDTYIWVTGPDGHRHRHFYGHGDRRQEIFRRRDNLHSVMAHHGGPAVEHRDAHAQSAHLEAIRRDQIHREEQAHAARGPNHGPANSANRGAEHGHADAHADGHANAHTNAGRSDNGHEVHAAANGQPARPDPHHVSAPAQGHAIHEASAEHSPSHAH